MKWHAIMLYAIPLFLDDVKVKWKIGRSLVISFAFSAPKTPLTLTESLQAIKVYVNKVNRFDQNKPKTPYKNPI